MAEQSMRERAIEAGMNVSAIGPYGDIVRRIVDAVLAEIETPTEGMIHAAALAMMTRWGVKYDKDKIPDLRGTSPALDAVVLFPAAIRAAREGR